jgi:SAM-dependent methyltransferase
MDPIYERLRDEFYLRLLTHWRPKRVVELASGSGRVTVPLARAGATQGSEIIGLEPEGPMLDEAKRKQAELEDDARRALTFVTGDMRAWRTEPRCDLSIAPCSWLSHLLPLEDQIAACAWDNLVEGRRFVVDVTMQPGRVRRVDADAAPDARRSRNETPQMVSA